MQNIEVDDVSHFMKKFVSFSLHLDTGEITNSFWIRYKDYLDNFEIPTDADYALLDELPKKLFAGIDIRTQEKIMERISMLHKMAFEGFHELSILYYEMLHQVLSYRHHGHDVDQWITSINTSRTVFGGLGENLGEDLYEYIRSLEERACGGEVVVVGDFPGTYRALQTTSLAMAFLYFATIKHVVRGKYCHHYALPEQMRTEEIQNTIDLVKRFDRLSKLIL